MASTLTDEQILRETGEKFNPLINQAKKNNKEITELVDRLIEEKSATIDSELRGHLNRALDAAFRSMSLLDIVESDLKHAKHRHSQVVKFGPSSD